MYQTVDANEVQLAAVQQSQTKCMNPDAAVYQRQQAAAATTTAFNVNSPSRSLLRWQDLASLGLCVSFSPSAFLLHGIPHSPSGAGLGRATSVDGSMDTPSASTT
jgi:hypothetical protein